MTRDELIKELANNYEKPVNAFEHKTNRELIDYWLKYNGIIGYTDDIVKVIEAAYNIILI